MKEIIQMNRLKKYKIPIGSMEITDDNLYISTTIKGIKIEKKSNDTIFIYEFSSIGEGSLNPPKQIYKKK